MWDDSFAGKDGSTVNNAVKPLRGKDLIDGLPIPDGNATPHDIPVFVAMWIDIQAGKAMAYRAVHV